MIFALGFFVSTLLGLMIVPALNERAERLARRRVEAQLPASVAELNAERDTLRAELAVRERRVEQHLERLRDKQALDMAELGRRATRIVELGEEGERARAEISRLEQELAATRNALSESEARAAGVSAELLDTRENLAARESALADLQARHDRALADLDSKRIQVSDLHTRLEAETGRAREIERVSRSRAEEIAELRTALERTRKALADEEARGAVLERRAEDFAGERDAAVEARIQSEAQLAQARDMQAHTSRDLAARHAELEKASARIAALEGHIALAQRKLDASDGQSRAAQDTLRGEIDGLRAEKSSLQGALDHARSERRRIEAEFAAYRKQSEKRLEAENATLRARIDEVTRLIMGEQAATTPEPGNNAEPVDDDANGNRARQPRKDKPGKRRAGNADKARTARAGEAQDPGGSPASVSQPKRVNTPDAASPVTPRSTGGDSDGNQASYDEVLR